MNFTDKLNKAIATNNSLLIVGLDPNPEMMSSQYIQGDERSRQSEQYYYEVFGVKKII